jgi:lysophospholipase L1-like esterase
MIDKIKRGKDVYWLGIGDSTYAGVGDSTFAGGWPPRFGQLIGAALKCKVVIGTTTIYVPNFGTGATLRMGTIGGPGTTYAYDINVIKDGAFDSLNAAGTPPDVIIMWGGINDMSLPSFGTFNPGLGTGETLASRINTIVSRARDAFGDLPQIIVSDQNAAETLSRLGLGYVDMFKTYCGQTSLPLVPVLVPASDSYPGMWCLDSHQAYGVMGTSDDRAVSDPLHYAQWMFDGFHPNTAGYIKLAQWMFDLLIANTIPLSPGDRPVVNTTTLDSLSIGFPFSQTLSATGTAPITWSLKSGSLPQGLRVDRETGILSGTPTLAESYSFTVKATNDYGSADRQFTGSIGVPFNPTGYTKVKQRQIGLYYPVQMNIRAGGQFHPVLPQN